MHLRPTSFFFVATMVLPFLASNEAHAQLGGLFGGGPKIETVDTSTVAKMLASQRAAEKEAKEARKPSPAANFVLVDVRSEAEVNVSVIPGAITKREFEQNREKYSGRVVIPYCTVGGRSGAYAKQLAKENVSVKNYKGSILKWIDAELPLVTLDGKPTHRVHTYSDRYKVPSKYEQVTQ
ncbi:rhodanese-like domain-containing protein [Rhodopirellula halodulae]|uniref:rhodanese-like domain-containing protein n=1 Tax=Rhodopirellula halodulae TaxID=2894198 RepID=UPI001E514565|nr:rhodanese-like domain-containing protein [Rhodopirellula sp. JC737]MCC9656281.1 rhodanese-like domain-containing protein [Rhodopirellula sp. JC737]